MTTLYEIEHDLRVQLAAIADEDLGPQEAAEKLRCLTGTFEKKLNAVVGYAMELKAIATTRIEHAKRLADSAKPIFNKVENLLDYAQISLQNIEMPMPLRLADFTLNLAKMPPKSMITDDDLVPDEYKTRTVTLTLKSGFTLADLNATFPQLKEQCDAMEAMTNISRSAILADLKEGVLIDGAKLEPLAYRLTVK